MLTLSQLEFCFWGQESIRQRVWQLTFCVVSLVILHFLRLATNCTMLDSANILGVVCSNFLCSFLKEQQYIIITSFRSFGQIFADKFWKITWISQNPLIQGVFFWLVIPKKLKYEKIFKYGTGHLENFRSPSTFMKVDTLTFFHHF